MRFSGAFLLPIALMRKHFLSPPSFPPLVWNPCGGAHEYTVGLITHHTKCKWLDSFYAREIQTAHLMPKPHRRRVQNVYFNAWKCWGESVLETLTRSCINFHPNHRSIISMCSRCRTIGGTHKDWIFNRYSFQDPSWERLQWRRLSLNDFILCCCDGENGKLNAEEKRGSSCGRRSQNYWWQFYAHF